MSKADIVIVNWNGLAYCQSLFPQLQGQLGDERGSVIVVDNASSDGSIEYIKTNYPWIRLVLSSANVGYAKGNNLALPHCTSKYILFLNNDTEIIDDEFLKKLIQHCEADSSIGAISPSLRLKDGRFQTGAGGYDRGLSSFASYFSGLSRASTLGLKPFYADQTSFSNAASVVELDWVSGASVLMRTDVVKSIGGWPTDYFMYAEDIKVCRLIRERGYKICLTPSCQIIHFHGGTEDKARPSTRWIDSTLGEYALRAGSVRGKAAAAIFVGGFCLRWIFYSIKTLLRPDSTTASSRNRMRVYAIAAWRFVYKN